MEVLYRNPKYIDLSPEHIYKCKTCESIVAFRENESTANILVHKEYVYMYNCPVCQGIVTDCDRLPDETDASI